MRSLATKSVLMIILALGTVGLMIFFAPASALPSTGWLPIVASFLSTFFGATFAFQLNTHKEKNKEDDSRLAALRISLFTLAQQQNYLAVVWKQLQRYEKSGDRAVHTPPLSLHEQKHMRQDLQALSFMIIDKPELLLELTVEDERFSQTIAALEQYSSFHVAQVQPALEKLERNKRMSIDEVRKGLGGRVYDTSEALVKQVFTHLVATRQSLGEIGPKIFAYSKSKFPKEKFLKMEIPNPADDTATGN